MNEFELVNKKIDEKLNGKYRVGVDLGTSNLRVGVIDEDFKVISRTVVKNNLNKSSEDIVSAVVDKVLAVVNDAGVDIADIKCFGVGSLGAVDAITGVVLNTGYSNFENIPLKKILSDKLGVKEDIVFIDNDANAAALGESLAGASVDVNNSICVTIGTSVGSGVIIDGKIFRGAGNVGVDLGHAVIVMSGERCSCGRHGCFTCYASGEALINQTRRMMASHPESLLWKLSDGNVESVTGKTAFDAMRLGDVAGGEVVKQYIRYVACGLINIINSFNPAVLSIGGAVCKEGELLIKPLIEYIEKEQYIKTSAFKTKICTAQLKNNAGIIGAAFLDSQPH